MNLKTPRSSVRGLARPGRDPANAQNVRVPPAIPGAFNENPLHLHSGHQHATSLEHPHRWEQVAPQPTTESAGKKGAEVGGGRREGAAWEGGPRGATVKEGGKHQEGKSSILNHLS